MLCGGSWLFLLSVLLHLLLTDLRDGEYPTRIVQMMMDCDGSWVLYFIVHMYLHKQYTIPPGWKTALVALFVCACVRFVFVCFRWASDAACWSWRRWLLERITCGDAGNKRKQMIYSILVDLSWYPFLIGMENAINPRWIRGWYQFRRWNWDARVSSFGSTSRMMCQVHCGGSYRGRFTTSRPGDVVRSYGVDNLLKISFNCSSWWSGRVTTREWCSAMLYVWYWEWLGSGGGIRCQCQTMSLRLMLTVLRSWLSLA